MCHVRELCMCNVWRFGNKFVLWRIVRKWMMNKIKSIIGAVALSLCFVATANAQEDKLVVSPSCRILLDGAFMRSSDDKADEQSVSGFNVPDVRIGMRATYGQWKAKADIGYGRSILSVKDVYLEYDIDKKNLIRCGYFVHQFGYQSATSSSFKVAVEEPETHTAFGMGERLLGIMFEHSGNKFLGTFSLYSDNQSFKKPANETGYQGSGVMSRLLFRPNTQRGNLFHIGGGLNYELASKNRANMKWTASYPTRVSNMKVIGTELQDAKSDFKVSTEVMAAKRNFGLEAQGIYMNVDRKGDAPNYSAWGAYANLRFLFNSEYTYTMNDAGIATPDPKSWELVASYNYTDMNDRDIQGGKMNDWSLTLNYYINKYIVWRVSGHYVNVGANNTGLAVTSDKNKFAVLESRLQIKF